MLHSSVDDMSSRGEATMTDVHADEREVLLPRMTDWESRLPRRLSVLLVAALSALSWVVLIALFMALRAIV
jgi:ABC-type cobalamin transport system permease subunit